jgi:methyl-accepting chemotaxis protein
LNSNKITVNDALISTDVDRLIRTISEKKKVGLDELEQLCSMDRRSIDKWVNVLEDEGYISISYGLRGTKVIWIGEDTPSTHQETSEVDEVLSNMPSKSKDYKDPEARLEEYLKKREDGEEDDLKANILGRLDEEKAVQDTAGPNPDLDEEPVVEVEEEQSEEAEEILPEEDFIETNNDFVKAEVVAKSFIEEEADVTLEEEPELVEAEPAEEPMLPPRIHGKSKSKQVRQLVNTYMNQINSEKVELEKLKAEKERIYRENYLALESKLEADIASITERMLEKQGRVLELKERVLELPEKVGEVEAVHDSIKKLEYDGREVLRNTKNDVEGFIEEMSRSRESIGAQIEESRTMLSSEQEKIEGLNNLSDSVDSKVENVGATLQNTKEQIGELNDKMRELLTELEEATEMKVEISDMVGRVATSVEEKEAELTQLEEQLENIDKLEQWVREYVTDYEHKIERISEFVQSSEEDLSSLRDSAESAHVQKYLRELDSMTNAYEQAVNDVSSQEREVDAQIGQTKTRLSSLVKDSKEMISKLRTGGADYELSQAAISEKSGRILAMVEEKEAERGKLSEDFDAARRGKPRASRPRAKKPAKKKKLKKTGKKRKSSKKKKK